MRRLCPATKSVFLSIIERGGVKGFPHNREAAFRARATHHTTLTVAWRTALEDRFLQAHVKGYARYADQVRYCLIPGVW